MKKLFIGGKWVAPAQADGIPVYSPATGESYDEIARGQASDIDLAMKAAREAINGVWGKTTATERGRILMKIGESVLANQEELAGIEAKDTGKPLELARKDIQALARYFEFYGSAADKVHGQVIQIGRASCRERV